MGDLLLYFRIHIIGQKIWLTVVAHVWHFVVLVLISIPENAYHLNKLPIVRFHNIERLLIQHEIGMRLRLILLINLDKLEIGG